jgi:hypothetical protein
MKSLKTLFRIIILLSAASFVGLNLGILIGKLINHFGLLPYIVRFMDFIMIFD